MDAERDRAPAAWARTMPMSAHGVIDAAMSTQPSAAFPPGSQRIGTTRNPPFFTELTMGSRSFDPEDSKTRYEY